MSGLLQRSVAMFFQLICHWSANFAPDCTDFRKRCEITTVRLACSAGMPLSAAISALFCGTCMSLPLPTASVNVLGPAAINYDSGIQRCRMIICGELHNNTEYEECGKMIT